MKKPVLRWHSGLPELNCWSVCRMSLFQTVYFVRDCRQNGPNLRQPSLPLHSGFGCCSPAWLMQIFSTRKPFSMNSRLRYGAVSPALTNFSRSSIRSWKPKKLWFPPRRSTRDERQFFTTASMPQHCQLAYFRSPCRPAAAKRFLRWPLPCTMPVPMANGALFTSSPTPASLNRLLTSSDRFLVMP